MVLFDTRKLADFKVEMYSKLLYKHHVVSSNKKLIEFKDDRDGNVVQPMTGYLALRGDKLYLLQGSVKDDLPIKIHEEELPTHVTKNGDVVHIVPYNTPHTEYYTSFRIKPDRMMSYYELLSMSDQKHSTGDEFTYLYGNLLYTSMCSRINVCVSGNVSSGKSSFADCLDSIYDCIPRIEKPSSAPALARGVSTNGVLFIDELSGLKTKEQKQGVETVINSLASGSNSISYGTAGSKAYRTQNPPPVNNLSCVIVYNLFGSKEDCQLDIKDSPFKPSYFRRVDFFDWMWPNQASLVDRFLRMRMPNGKLDVAQFLNGGTLSDEDIITLKKMAKTLAYYREVAQKGFTQSVEGYEPELTQDDIDYILAYIKNDMGISDDSRYLSSLLELLKFAMVASNRNRDKFRWYADGYKRWIEDYQKMIGLSPISDWEKDNKLTTDTTVSTPKKLDKPAMPKEVNMNEELGKFENKSNPLDEFDKFVEEQLL
jgi:hypothetical protein